MCEREYECEWIVRCHKGPAGTDGSGDGDVCASRERNTHSGYEAANMCEVIQVWQEPNPQVDDYTQKELWNRIVSYPSQQLVSHLKNSNLQRFQKLPALQCSTYAPPFRSSG